MIYGKRLLGYLLLIVLLALPFAAQAQGITPTPPVNGPYVIVTYDEEINVRAGPGTLYEIVGKLAPGAIAPALGLSPGRVWVLIQYPAAPGGKGWVHSTLIQLVTTQELPIIQPPPTPTPLVTPTIDPTLMAAFHFEPTATRLPTFTAAPSLVIPTFSVPGTGPVQNSGTVGIYIIGFALLGVLSLVLSLWQRER